MTRAVIGTLVALSCAAAAQADARRGAMAFFYGRSMTAEQQAWYSRFEIVVTHDPLPAAQSRALKNAGAKLLLYEWAVAFYGSRAAKGSWQHDLLARRSPALLNHAGLRGHLGAPGAEAFYFDPAAPEHAERRPAEIARALRQAGYEGIFLDTTTAASVHPEALREFERRHGGASYDAAFSRFLRNLREMVPGIVMASNQGYRRAADILPFVDVDVTESLITHPRGGRWELRAWNDPGDPWNSILPLMQRLLDPLRSKYPRVRFVHLNYLAAPDDAGVSTVVAIARLFGDEAFVTVPDLQGNGTEIHDPYFFDPGRPGPLVATKEGALRRFANAVIEVRTKPRLHAVVTRKAER